MRCAGCALVSRFGVMLPVLATSGSAKSILVNLLTSTVETANRLITEEAFPHVVPKRAKAKANDEGQRQGRRVARVIIVGRRR